MRREVIGSKMSSFKENIKALGQSLWCTYRVLRDKSYKHTSTYEKPLNEKIIILGNGPSLKENLENDLELLQNSETMAVNKFCLTEVYETIKPNYYVIVDPLFMMDNVTDEYKKLQDEVFDRFEAITTWDMKLFIVCRGKGSARLKQLIQRKPNIQVQYIPITTVEGLKSVSHYYYKKGWGTPFVGNVIISSLMSAINCGFKEIILLGIDHTIHTTAFVNSENLVCFRKQHYYDDEPVDIPVYVDLEETTPIKMHEYLKHWVDTFRAYHQINDYALSRDVKIINATPVSNVDAFERDILK